MGAQRQNCVIDVDAKDTRGALGALRRDPRISSDASTEALREPLASMPRHRSAGHGLP
jgi:hypothetical protein